MSTSIPYEAKIGKRKRWEPTMYQVIGSRPPRNAKSRPSSRPTRKERNYTPAPGLTEAERARINNVKRSRAETLTALMRSGRMVGYCSLPAMRAILREGF